MKRRAWAVWFLLLCLLLSACRGTRSAPPLRIHVLDVGQGDAVLLRTREGDVLLDAGPEAAQETLCLRLEQLGVTELELAIFTHMDEDHVGGADGILRQIPTKEIWVNNYAFPNPSAERMRLAAEQTGAPIRVANPKETVVFGEVVLSVLAPLQTHIGTGNEGSLAIRLQCGVSSALFTGDAGIEQEQRLIEEYGDALLDCDLYKVGHHGSGTSSGERFLAYLSPQYAVVSCGEANRYGHPFGEVLARLEASGATVLRTDLLGELVFECDGETLWMPAK